jgi:hypothetical protein
LRRNNGLRSLFGARPPARPNGAGGPGEPLPLPTRARLLILDRRSHGSLHPLRSRARTSRLSPRFLSCVSESRDRSSYAAAAAQWSAHFCVQVRNLVRKVRSSEEQDGAVAPMLIASEEINFSCMFIGITPGHVGLALMLIRVFTSRDAATRALLHSVGESFLCRRCWALSHPSDDERRIYR